MFCPNCGNEVSEGSRFCENCGAPLSQPVAASQQPAPQPIQNQTAQTWQNNSMPANGGGRGRKNMGIFVIAAVIVICIIAVIFIFSSGGNNADINDEEQEVLNTLYQALSKNDIETAVQTLHANETTLYSLEQKYFPGDIVTYDGRHLSNSLKSGKKLAIKAESEGPSHSSSVSDSWDFYITVYFGNFKSDVPSGSFITLYTDPSFYLTYFNRSNIAMHGNVYVVECDYDKGEAVGISDVQYWEDENFDVDDPEIHPLSLSISYSGMLEDERYTGDVEITYYPIAVQELGKIGHTGLVPIDEIVRGIENAETSYKGTSSTLLDDTGVYFIPTSLIRSLPQSDFYWDYNVDEEGISHTLDSKDILPDGTYLSDRLEAERK